METKIKKIGGEFSNTYLLSTFVAACQQKAIEANCNILDIRVYGGGYCEFIQASFNVDNFGGIAYLVTARGEMDFSYSSDAKTHYTIFMDEALAGVVDAYKAEEAARTGVEMFNCD